MNEDLLERLDALDKLHERLRPTLERHFENDGVCPPAPAALDNMTLEELHEQLRPTLERHSAPAAADNMTLEELLSEYHQELQVFSQLLQNPVPKKLVILMSDTLQLGYFLDSVQRYTEAIQRFRQQPASWQPIANAAQRLLYQFGGAHTEAERLYRPKE